MANETRRYANFVGGLVDDNPLTAVATTLTSDGLSALPAVSSTEHMAITLDPDGLGGAPEIAWVTAHSAAVTTATISRGEEGTLQREHLRDVPWVHAMTTEDVGLSPWHVSIPAEALPFSAIGTWTHVIHADATNFANGGSALSNVAGTQNDEVVYKVPLSTGVWTFRLWHRKSTNVGIYTVSINGVSAGTIDGYAAAPAAGRDDIAGITVASSGVKSLTLKMATKNGSSSAYTGTIQAIGLTRTA